MNYFKGKTGPVLIAEIGGNHEGNFEYAKKLTEMAISTDVDFVKFQLYTGDTLVSRVESETRNKHFKKFELTKEQHIELANLVNNSGIHYMASVWDEDIMEWINPYMPVYKVGSGDLTAYPILKKIVEKGKPIVISTGLSTEQEVLDSVAYIQSLDKRYLQPEMLAILQCTSMYPITDSDANLNVIPRLKELTGLTVGYSDHTEGMTALEYSVLMGAQVLEFHFTDNREGKQFRDHKVSLVPDEVKQLKDKIGRIKKFQGSSKKQPLPIELEVQHEISFRRAVYPKIDIKAGTILTNEHLTTLRPNHGIDAREYEKLLGRTTKIDLLAHQKLEWEMFE